MDETTCMVWVARNLLYFYKHESCGKCTPCREGFWWLVQILERLEQGAGTEAEGSFALCACSTVSTSTSSEGCWKIASCRCGSNGSPTSPNRVAAVIGRKPIHLLEADQAPEMQARHREQQSEPPAARFAFLPGGHPQGYADCFDAFVAEFYEGVRSGSTVEGMPTFSDGLRAAHITDAVLASSREERWVDLSAVTLDSRVVAT
jgi:hypothetical protein